ncbi:uncharacterized protein LOC120626304 [Pararge aegeria]|nr:uncharacterized protein LOC120626304 [Pararge aegeria]
MASLYIMIVGLLHFVNVEPAPTPLTDSWISERISHYQENTQKEAPLGTPILANRFNLEDKRQNWGLLRNGSIYNENDDTNYGSRPITIPRLSANNPHLSTENIGQKISEISVPFKTKRFLDQKPEVNGVLKVTNNNVPRKIPLQCDVARIKCCFDNLDLNNCSKASECFNLENKSDLCDARVLQEGIRRVISFI